jgi:hypothetical protein
MPKPEALLNRAVAEYLTLRGYIFKRNQSGRVFGSSGGKKWAINLGEAGWGDFIGLTHDGVFFTIEDKVKPNKPTELQLAFMERVKKSKGISVLAYSLDDVIKAGL